MAAVSSFAGVSLQTQRQTRVEKVSTKVVANVKKSDNKAVKYGAPSTATGSSKLMKSANWVDAQGRKGTGKGYYQFESKYGANVDGYSPIYSPNTWAANGDTYKGGAQGLAIWAGILAVGLATSAALIFGTSALAQ